MPSPSLRLLLAALHPGSLLTRLATSLLPLLLTLTVGAATPSPIKIAPATLPALTAGSAFSVALTATGGTAPYTWSLPVAPLPKGLQLNPATGLVSGTPTTAGNAVIFVRVTDAAGLKTQRGWNVAIAAGSWDPALPPPPPPPTGGGVSQGTPNLTAGRFLEQAAYGPTPAEITKVKTIGIPAWLDQQFALPETPITNPGGMAMATVQSDALYRMIAAPDQLRQRVVAALGGIIVVSAAKNIYPDELVPYLQILSRNAFGNYRTLLDEVARSSPMGKYLDHANSNRPTPGSAANENFARELMQLFTIGLNELNPDGSDRLDALGHTIPAYTQFTVQQVALALTGWTYPGPADNNHPNFSGPLQARQINHDTGAKTLVGVTLPAGQTAEADLAGVLDWLFHHANTAPFISTRLIRALVKSNPSPAYIARISAVFANNGSGVRGDLRAVVRAILTDVEARNDTPSADSGRLKDPILNIAAFVRALGGSISPTNRQPFSFTRMSQTPLAPTTVFGFYSPLYHVPRSATLIGPEFQIYGPTEAGLRGNYFWLILSNPGADFPISIAPFITLAGDTIALIDAVDQTLLYGRMPTAMRQSLADAINAESDITTKARTALYLTALSGFYAVHH
jgi:uncharacterized protein (DUF1800 family)